jgi:hypothetical protein
MGTFPTGQDFNRAVPAPVDGTISGTAPPIPTINSGAESSASIGQSFNRIGDAVEQYGLHLDTLAAQDALNQFRKAKQDLTYGAENGFMNKQGGAVLKDPDGQPAMLLPTWTNKLQEAAAPLAGPLSPRARQMYQARVAEEMNSYRGEILKHTLQQTEVYNKSVYSDTTSTLLTEGQRNSGNIRMLDSIADKMERATRNYAMGLGLAPDSAAKAARSNVYRAAIEDKIASNDGAGALALFNLKKGDLDGKDSIEVEGQIKTVDVSQTARAYVGNMAGGGGTVTPSLVHHAIVGQESGGQQFDSKGNVLTSVDGAKGAGQMIPATFQKYALPGEVIANKDDNLAASRRAIDDYYRKYNGDWQRVSVAYFSGEGNVASEGSPTPWKNDAKDGNGKSTSGYVADVGKRMGIAASKAPADPLQKAVDASSPVPGEPKTEGPPGFLDTRKLTIDAEKWRIDATAKNTADWVSNPPQMAANQQLINVQYEQKKQLIQLQKDQLNNAVQDWVTKPLPNGMPQTERPPPAVWNQLTFEQHRSIDSTLTHNAKGAERVTDMSTFYQLERMAGAQPVDFANVDLMQYYTKLSKTDFEKLSGYQKTALGNDPTAGDLRDKHAIVRDGGQAAGLKLDGVRSGTEAAAANSFLSWVEEAGKSWTAQNGRKPNGKEWQAIVDGVTMKIPSGSAWSGDKRLDEMTIDDVPKATQTQFLQTFAQRGAPEPSDHDIIAMAAAGRVGVVPPTYVPILAAELKKRGRAVTPQTLLGAWNLVSQSYGQNEPASSEPTDLAPGRPAMPPVSAPIPAAPVAGNPLPQNQRLPVPSIGPRP